MMKFNEYIDRTDDETTKRLNTIRKALQRGGYRVQDFALKDQDPHIFVYALPKVATFEGIRIYLLGDILAFKAQKKVETEPYGKAYTFAIQDMYDDMVLEYGDSPDKELPVKKTILKMADELRMFFVKSKTAEESLVQMQLTSIEDKSGQKDGIVVNTTGTDYANKVYSQGN